MSHSCSKPITRQVLVVLTKIGFSILDSELQPNSQCLATVVCTSIGRWR